jgi:hypothetical protein
LFLIKNGTAKTKHGKPSKKAVTLVPAWLVPPGPNDYYFQIEKSDGERASRMR